MPGLIIIIDIGFPVHSSYTSLCVSEISNAIGISEGLLGQFLS